MDKVPQSIRPDTIFQALSGACDNGVYIHSGDQALALRLVGRCEVRVGGARGSILWHRLTAGLPCTLDEYVAATAFIGAVAVSS